MIELSTSVSELCVRRAAFAATMIIESVQQPAHMGREGQKLNRSARTIKSEQQVLHKIIILREAMVATAVSPIHHRRRFSCECS